MTVRAGIDTDSELIFVEVAETIKGADGIPLSTSSQGHITASAARMLAQQLEEAANTLDQYHNGAFDI